MTPLGPPSAALLLVGMLSGAAVLAWAQDRDRCAGLRAIDGDTLALDCGDGPVTVRLRDIDAPELRGCAGAAALAARDALDALTAGHPLTLIARGADRWGRTVGAVEADGRDLGAALVAAGHARPWPHDDTGRAMAPRPDWCGE